MLEGSRAIQLTKSLYVEGRKGDQDRRILPILEQDIPDAGGLLRDYRPC
jgi:hypothetical protein